MTIAVDTRCLASDAFSELAVFTREVFQRITKANPQHTFIFIVDGPLKDTVNFSANASFASITSKPSNTIAIKWWYDVKLPKVLKKYKADVFIGLQGFCSSLTTLPQLIVVHNLDAFQKEGRAVINRLFLKNNTSDCIKKASKIVTLSQFVKNGLAEHFQIKKEKIEVIGFGARADYKPVDWEERESIKQEVAEGAEYFVFTPVNGSQLMTMLKAFSIFKKWQKTNMKLLVLLQQDEKEPNSELEKLSSYKYKNDVFVKNNLSEQKKSKVIAASYAVVRSNYYQGFGLEIAESMQSEAPVITLASPLITEIADDAALYFNSQKPEDIAAEIKKIFKDEALRTKLIAAGKDRIQEFDFDKTAALLWLLINQTASK
jgi:glycosyltransferase involved in cell wall biosynthesis